ncbi:hypothetical protein BN903_88 [Halorubrum sp. AJ67]|nr:hypothetical protein BN903_88 [Halorubrum sp. AJ67]
MVEGCRDAGICLFTLSTNQTRHAQNPVRKDAVSSVLREAKTQEARTAIP